MLDRYWLKPFDKLVFNVNKLVFNKLGVILTTAAYLLLVLPVRMYGYEIPLDGMAANTALKLDTDSVAPKRFIAVPGRQSLIAGYASEGLEVWAYPFQILSDYKIAFHVDGTTSLVSGSAALRRITYEPDSVTRTYIGPNFIVHEKLFVPLNQAGAIISYQVESKLPVDIQVNAAPILNLMWPAALGAQSVSWNNSIKAYVLSEPAEGYSATVGSSEIVSHDDVVNRTTSGPSNTGIAFTLRPDGAGRARVFVALNPAHAEDPEARLKQLVRQSEALEVEYREHLRSYLDSIIKVETPIHEVNQAIRWSEIALDQAWVCNSKIGCGFVAGYGPSRDARRPQYNWFFAEDGLIAADASLSACDFNRARQELEFILQHRDQKTGMIWHEISQSAGLIDWINKYPYMFVHVDITFYFLSMLDRYVTTSGDTAFVRNNWDAIDSAYKYCRSVIDPLDGLPRIPPDKTGGNEQDRLSDDLGLSTSWVATTAAFAHMASLAKHHDSAELAMQANRTARASIPLRYWNSQQSFWISGHIASGAATLERRSAPEAAISLHIFNAEQNTTLLKQLASSSFQTDWGTRGVALGSAGYDPESYSKGSVTVMNTTSLARTLWDEHFPASAMNLWRTLLPWFSLDSLGHLHEVLAGNFYQAQIESVPEQTWSSAGFLDATIHGLLGLKIDAIDNRVLFAPHLPAEWQHVSLEHVRLGDRNISLALQRTNDGLTLAINNSGGKFNFEFAPEVALGARLLRAELNHHAIPAKLESHSQESDVKAAFEVLPGKNEVKIETRGGILLSTDPPKPLLGNASTGVRLIETRLENHLLTVEADVPSNLASHFRIQSEWPIMQIVGAQAQAVSVGATEFTFPPSPESKPSQFYRRVKASVQFKQ